MTLPSYEEREVVLDIDHISLSYGDKRVLRDVTATIRNIYRPGYTTGQIVAILGPSGCGKSTLLRILAGLLKPTSGRVSLGPTKLPVERGKVGLVSQNYQLFRPRTVLGNMLVAARMMGYGPNDALHHAAILLGRFDLWDCRGMYPAELSGGMRQRVAICQQLVCSEHLLLMDEPFAALDYANIQKAIALIHEVANGDDLNTIVIVTHSIPDALCVADHLWILDRETDALGQKMEGSKIVREIDLISCGLCWSPEIAANPLFHQLQNDIQAMFRR